VAVLGPPGPDTDGHETGRLVAQESALGSCTCRIELKPWSTPWRVALQRWRQVAASLGKGFHIIRHRGALWLIRGAFVNAKRPC